jgi:hypothetical protein
MVVAWAGTSTSSIDLRPSKLDSLLHLDFLAQATGFSAFSCFQGSKMPLADASGIDLFGGRMSYPKRPVT